MRSLPGRVGRIITLASREPPLPRSYGAGCTISNDGAPDEDINITAGQWRDSTDTVNLIVPSEFTKAIDATFAEGNDAGGFPDTSLNLAASTWYHFHLIGTSGGKVDAGFDTSVTATNLLSDAQAVDTNFRFFRRIGSILTDATSDILLFSQLGDEFLWPVPVLDVDGEVIASAGEALTLTSTPLGVQVWAIVNVIQADGGGDPQAINVSPIEQTTNTPSSTAAPLFNIGPTDAGFNEISNQLRIRTSTTQTINARSKTGGETLELATIGWIDRRGRDD